ncbi:MAG TPA: transglutaminase family protein [Acidimicrobiales bacterium]|nr:transglutaminase family protein [Acidimicrobiales bacterium]
MGHGRAADATPPRRVTGMRRRVAARLVLHSPGPLDGVLQVAVATLDGLDVAEHLAVAADGTAVATSEVDLGHTTRGHLLRGPPGRYVIEYAATVTGRAAAVPVGEVDRLTFLRPSRYAESDRLAATAVAEFAGLTDPAELLAAVSSWVGRRLSYVPGSSGPTSGAIDTLLERRGVCRDYAHLVVALLRAVDVPARVAAVYAPGLTPMDFHAVAEALVDGTWRVVDATLLAPRQSLVRISTGRDAADTAFLSTFGEPVELLELEVGAVVDGPLPSDDVTGLVTLG